jgi:hypothetical protein
MKERPAAVRALNAAQIDGNLSFQRGVNRFGKVMAQQDVFGRNGGVGLKLEYPMAVGLLTREYGVGRRSDRAIELRSSAFRIGASYMVCGMGHFFIHS